MNNTLDFVPGVDFAGLPSVEAADLDANSRTTVPRPEDGDETQGKSLNLATTDTAINTPVVPDPTSSILLTKWKRYTWVRRPFAGAANKGSKRYTWNDDAVSDAILLKWVLDNPDIGNIATVANNALITANNAVAIANNSALLAGTANATAANANNTAATAQTAANDAQTTATNAAISAATAATKADAAQADATTAIKNNPSVKRYIKISETQAKGTDAGASAAGKNTRILNTIEYNGASNAVTLDAVTGLVTITIAGYYRVEAQATMFDNSNNTHQLLLVNNTDNATLLTGYSMTFNSGGSTTQRSAVCGCLFLNAGQVIRLDHYITNAQALNGLGQAANIHPDIGGREVYSILELFNIPA